MDANVYLVSAEEKGANTEGQGHKQGLGRVSTSRSLISTLLQVRGVHMSWAGQKQGGGDRFYIRVWRLGLGLGLGAKLMLCT